VVAAAAAVVIFAIVISSSGGSGNSTKPPAKGSPASGVATTEALFAGIPQKGNTLGSPKAPVTLQEFADLQCPVCQAYTLDSMPTLIQNYVRPGKVRMVFHQLPILGRTPCARLRWRQARPSRTGCGTSPTSSTATRARRTRLRHPRVPGQDHLRAPASTAPRRWPSPRPAAARAQLAADQVLSNRFAFNATPSFLSARPAPPGRR
jgi:protein-disulfide isomerase